MATSNDKHIEGGLELDKLKVAKVERSSLPPTKELPEIKFKSDPFDTSLTLSTSKIILTISSIIMLLTVTFFLWDRAIIPLPFLENKRAKRLADVYSTVGPILTSVGNAGNMKMTLKLKSRNQKLKKKVSKMDIRLRNVIIVALNSSDARKIIKKRDYNALRSYLKKAINQTLKDIAIEDVYFSEITMY